MSTLYLAHHGIQGQKWGVRNGPPYPIVRTRKGNAKDINKVQKNWSKKDNKYFWGDEKGVKYEQIYFNSDRSKYSKVTIDGNTPVSFIDIAKTRDNGKDVLNLAIGSSAVARQKGYAAKLVSEGKKWFESQTEFDKMIWVADKDNVASNKLAQKQGFEYEKSFKAEGQTWNQYYIQRGKSYMDKVLFVSGSSKTQDKNSGYYRQQLPKEIKNYIDDFMSKNGKLIVGDAPGIDRQVQNYAKKKGYSNVEVYGPGDKVRYSANKKWKTNPIAAPEFEAYSPEWLRKKDIAMTNASTEGLAVVLENGGAGATRNNVQRLIEQNKNVKVYELYSDKKEDKWVR